LPSLIGYLLVELQHGAEVHEGQPVAIHDADYALG
jgi:hypothetical protein